MINSNPNTISLSVLEDAIDSAMKGEVNASANPFPIDVFPCLFKDLILDLNSSLNFPIDYTATSILTAISTAVGTTVKARVKHCILPARIT